MGKSGSGVFLLVIKYFHILSVDTHNIDIKYQKLNTISESDIQGGT